MSLTSIPNEIFCMFAEYLSLRDLSALTLTNQHIASILPYRLQLRLHSLPLHDGHYAELALHWASVTGNLPRLKELLETVTTLTVIDRPAPYPRTINQFTTPGPCPDNIWSWISTRGANLRLFNPTSTFRRYTHSGMTTAEFAILSNNNALLRRALAASDSRRHANHVLRFAGHHGHKDVLQTALAWFHDRFGRTAWEEARKAVLESIMPSRGLQYFLNPGENRKSRDQNGRTFLHRAVAGLLFHIEGEVGANEAGTRSLSCPEVVRAFLLRRVKVDVCDGNGDTALHIAAELGHIDVVDLLLQGKATVDVRDAAGCTPLHRALRSAWHERWDIAEMLRLNGADFGIVDSAGVAARELLQGPMELRSSRSRKSQ